MISWQTKQVKISELKEYKNNPRKIFQSNLEKLSTHLKEDGYHQRIIVDQDLTIIGGHQRKKALLLSGHKENDMIEVLVPDRKLTEHDLDRLNIRDNLIFGEFDLEILADRFDLETLHDFGLDDNILSGLDKIFLESDSSDEKESILPTDAKGKLGDSYKLGNHRLLCGDSTNPDHVKKLLDGVKPILMVTDLPYGVNYEPEWRDKVGRGITNTGKVLNDDKFDWSEAYSLFEGEVAYIWHAASFTHKIAQNIEDCGFDLINLIIWHKQHFVLSRGDYHNQHEPCWYAVRKGAKHNWQGKRDQSTVWEIDNNNHGAKTKEEQTGHSTQKPIECMLKPILNNSKIGEGVYDPFGGSGTTLIACERASRSCYMMELSPAYVDIIISRWEKETGLKAEVLNE